MHAGKDCEWTAANAGGDGRIAYHFTMDLRKLEPWSRAGTRVAEQGAQRMSALARTTLTDTARGRAGFSIVELMIVLVIVGIMTMAVAPSMGEMLSGNRHASAAMDLVKFARSTRSAAVSSGAAQLMRFLQAGSGNLGIIERYVGMNNRCRQSRWDIAMSNDPGQGAKRALGFDMAQYNPGAAPTTDDSGQQIIKLAAVAPAGSTNVLSDLWLCYQPDGQVYAQYANGDPSGKDLQVQNLDVEFTISRSVHGERHGTDRRILFPSGGNARLE